MRAFSLVTAAFAVSIVFAAPAALAQGSLSKIYDLCPDLTGTEIKERFAILVSENHKFSNDPDLNKQAEDTAYHLCAYGYDSAEADLGAEQQPETIQAAVGHPQRGPQFSGPEFERNMPRFSHNAPPPRRHMQRPPPRFAPVHPGARPHGLPPHHALPPLGLQRIPPPSARYGHRPAPPMRAMAAARGYQEHHVHAERHRSAKPHALPVMKSIKGPPYCLAVRDGAEAYEERYPMPRGYAPGACTIGKVPGEPCPGWVCSRGG
jgi:hypothetical protein